MDTPNGLYVIYDLGRDHAPARCGGAPGRAWPADLGRRPAALNPSTIRSPGNGSTTRANSGASRAEAGEIALVRSPAHLVENDANPREDRRLAAALWIDGAAVNVPLDAAVEVRAGELVALGVRPLDALHVACAERAAARWFVTCDDELLKLAGRLGDALRTLVVAPRALAWKGDS